MSEEANLFTNQEAQMCAYELIEKYREVGRFALESSEDDIYDQKTQQGMAELSKSLSGIENLLADELRGNIAYNWARKRMYPDKWDEVINRNLRLNQPLSVDSTSLETEQSASGRRDELGLTKRQYAVLGLASQGLSSLDIGARLNLSADEVNHELNEVYKKTNAADRTDSTLRISKKEDELLKSREGDLSEPERGDGVKVDNPVKLEHFLPSIGIRAAREIVKLLPTGSLDDLDINTLTFTIKNPELLSLLRTLRVITKEEQEAKEIGIDGVAVALAWSNERAKTLLAEKEAPAYAHIIITAARDEVLVQARTYQESIRGRANTKA